MIPLTYGTLPDDLSIDEPYAMSLNAPDEALVASIINQGIDSHLEAVSVDDRGIRDHHHDIDIRDTASLRCFLRRLVERGDDEALDFASYILSTLNYEWI
jgi:hypothetical protein